MSFNSRDLMAHVPTVQGRFACVDVTKSQEDQQCVDPTKKPPAHYPESVESELSFAALREQLRAALSPEQAAPN
jgi:hypothetical protein